MTPARLRDRLPVNGLVEECERGLALGQRIRREVTEVVAARWVCAMDQATSFLKSIGHSRAGESDVG